MDHPIDGNRHSFQRNSGCGDRNITFNILECTCLTDGRPSFHCGKNNGLSDGIYSTFRAALHGSNATECPEAVNVMESVYTGENFSYSRQRAKQAVRFFSDFSSNDVITGERGRKERNKGNQGKKSDEHTDELPADSGMTKWLTEKTGTCKEKTATLCIPPTSNCGQKDLCTGRWIKQQCKDNRPACNSGLGKYLSTLQCEDKTGFCKCQPGCKPPWEEADAVKWTER